MSVTIATAQGRPYPSSDDAYSPSEAYPEYVHEHVSSAPNHVYSQLRELLQHHGLDKGNAGTPRWNPLRELVPEGSKVFVLCNFVSHRRSNESEANFEAKCTHGSVLRALVDYLLLAVGPSGQVHFGNAPNQSCSFSQVLADARADVVEAFYRERGVPVESRDLRLYVTKRDAFGRTQSVEHRDEADGVEIDLRERSHLADVPGTDGQRSPFRVSDYDPRRIEAFHADGRHRYVIHREILEADVVFSLSKLKTHEKVGVTCGLKGMVGTVGHKDCLAHHRFGNPSIGGDEYPDANAFLRPLSRFHDWVHRGERGALLQNLVQIADLNLRRIARRSGLTNTGAWHGNDTCWRMALDLARIVHYASVAGEMASSQQRRHVSLIDGIVAGEGNGPLSPQAVAAGALVLGEEVALTDRIACRLMGFDPNLIPLIHEACAENPWPLSRSEVPAECNLDGRPVLEDTLPPLLSRPFEPPKGWKSRLAPRG